jgi:trans-aconitate methyltransferase
MAWNESDSEHFIDVGHIITPRRDEMGESLLDLLPAERDEDFLAVEIGCGAGWLSERLLQRFPRARVVALDGSETMLREAGRRLERFQERVELQQFRLEDADWPARFQDVRCFFSSLVIHHLNAPGKRALFANLYRRLAPGGALLIADLIAPLSEWERRHMAGAWDAETRRQALEFTGEETVYTNFVNDGWNIYDYPDPMDMPSPLPDQLTWLAEAGFDGVGAFWVRAGHAVYGGYTGARPADPPQPGGPEL